MSNIEVTQGQGKKVATYIDQDGENHQAVVGEYLDGANEPTPVAEATPFPIKDMAANSGGASAKHTRTLGSAGEDISTGKSLLYGFDAVNNGASDAYLKFYDKAYGDINPAVDVPVAGPFTIPASGGFFGKAFVKGIQFTNRISARVVTGIADNDVTSPVSGDVIVNLEYKQ